MTIIRSLTAGVLTVTHVLRGAAVSRHDEPGTRRRPGVGADHVDDRWSRDRAVGTGRAAAERGLHRRHQLGQRTLTGVCGLWMLNCPLAAACWRCQTAERVSARAPSGDGGAAVADFALVSALVTLLFLAVFQVGLALHIRNTLIACASGGRALRSAG